MPNVRWGVFSVAKIGTQKVIPAMQAGQFCEVAAIASRDLTRAQDAARRLGIDTAYGSYEELLADADIDAVYVPLPNHLHVPWSIRALEAGKHVLCEKPIGLNLVEAEKLLAASQQYPNLKVMEAFMYRHHPQWQRARQLVANGEIGRLRTIQTLFSYFNDNPHDIRNQVNFGGGGLMDIGCYPISASRWIFDAEPQRVCALVERDPKFGTDRLASGLLEFDDGTATFTCSTQLAPYQRVNICGTDGRLEIEIPFNAPPDRRCRLWHQHDTEIDEITFDVCNQYTIQGDLFSQAVLNDTPVPTPLDDAVANMRVIEAFVRSAKSGTWAAVGGA